MKKRLNTSIFPKGPAQALKIATVLAVFAVVTSVRSDQVVETTVKGPGPATKGHPAAGSGNDIIVRLELPWSVLLGGESLSYNYIIENHSSTPIPIAIPYRKYGLGTPVGGQAFLEGFYNPEPSWRSLPGNEDQPWLRVQSAEWPPMGMEGQPMENWTELAPGQRLVWDHDRIQPGYYRLSADDGLVGIQAHWLVGPGKWISSKALPTRVVQVRESEWVEMFSAQWSIFDSALDKRKTKIWKIPIEKRVCAPITAT